MAFSPDGRFVYASLSGEDAVAKVDLQERRTAGKVAVGAGPIQTFVTRDDSLGGGHGGFRGHRDR